jgi:hypothetical protein
MMKRKLGRSVLWRDCEGELENPEGALLAAIPLPSSPMNLRRSIYRLSTWQLYSFLDLNAIRKSMPDPIQGVLDAERVIKLLLPDKSGRLHNFEVLLSNDFIRGGVSNTQLVAFHVH